MHRASPLNFNCMDSTLRELLLETQNKNVQIARAYNMTVGVYTEAKNVTPVKNVFAFMFTNTGDTTAFVNGMVIYPGTPGSVLGDSRSISGHVLDLYKGNIQLAFDTVAPGTNPKVEIVQLFYAEDYSS